MESSNAAYRSHLVNHLPSLLKDADTAQRLRFVMTPLLSLVLLDLSPAEPVLTQCYRGAHVKRGRSRRDPVMLLRSLVLMMLCGMTSINQWVKRLKGSAELRVLSGLEPQRTPPGVGTLYDFLWRLVDGPWQARCAHHERPSKRLRGRHFIRQLEQERQEQKAQTQAELARSQHKRVEHLVEAARQSLGQPSPQDLTQRLNEVLMRCAVVPSALMGLLGELRRLKVAGDGTAIPAAAAGDGHRDCDCAALGEPRCECPRRYSDPEAKWGYDSHRKVYYFGYRLHVISTRGGGDDLPLHVGVQGAHTPDVVMGVEGLVRLVKRLTETGLEAKIWAALWDAGYDATAFYKLHRQMEIHPVIPLAQEAKTPECGQGVARNEEGVPLCVGGLPMRMHQRSTDEIVYNCPVKRPGRTQGRTEFKARVQECPLGVLCEPESVMGPLVHIRLDGDPRMNLAIPRGSQQFTELFKERTATERYNSTLKSKGQMARGAYRRQHLVLAAAVLHALGLHAQAWVGHVFGERRPATVDGVLSWCRDGAGQGRQAA